MWFMTKDETWSRCFDPERKQQSMTWQRPIWSFELYEEIQSVKLGGNGYGVRFFGML